MARFRTIAAKYELVEKVLAYVAGFILVLMGITIFYDVVARSFFNSPTAWSFELNMNFLLYFAFLAGGYTLASDGHVRVDILYSRWRPRTQAIVDIITFLFALVFIIVLVRSGLDLAVTSLETGKRSLQIMRWPLFPLQIMIPIGGTLVGLQMVIKIVRDVYVIISPPSSIVTIVPGKEV